VDNVIMKGGDISMRNFLAVSVVWDKEAEVWVAESDDVPGLVTEAATMEELSRKLDVMIPEMLEANGSYYNFAVQNAIPYKMLSEHIAGRNA
jgi:predicted RNase H-like HicB family nuclease